MATQDLIEHIAQLRVGFEAAIETVRESASRVSHDAGNNLTMMEGDIAKALIDDVASENFKRIQKSPLFAVTLPIPTGHSKEAIVAEISRKIASTCSTLPEYLLIQLYRSFEVLCNQWLAPSSTSGQQIDFPKHPKPRLVTKSREGIALDALSEESMSSFPQELRQTKLRGNHQQITGKTKKIIQLLTQVLNLIITQSISR